MSGSLIGGIFGAAIGFVASGFNPMGAYWGWAIGSAAGGFLSHQTTSQTMPKLGDLRPQSSEYGRPIPVIYGTVAIGGNVIWAPDLIAVETTTETDVGKGGGNTVSTTATAYYANFAVLVGEGVLEVGRIWAGPEKRLIWDGTTLEGGTMRIYKGDETQLPDALIEADLGVGNVPAYRGYCYIVFEQFPLHNDGNMIPFLTIEAGRRGGHPPQPVYLGLSSVPATGVSMVNAVYDPVNRQIWSYNYQLFTSTLTVNVNSDVTQSNVKTFNIPTSSFTPEDITYIAANGDQSALIAVTGEQFGAFIDITYLFSANDLNAAPGIYSGPYHGTGLTELTYYNPTTKFLMGFRRGGNYAADLLGSTDTTLAAEDNFGTGVPGGLGTTNPVAAITCGNNYAVAWIGSVPMVIVRALSNNALIGYWTNAQIVTPSNKWQMAYDSVRNRIVITHISGIQYDYIDLTALTFTNGASLSLPANADTSPAISTALVQGIAYINDQYVFAYENGSGYGTAVVIVDPGTGLAVNAYSYEAYNPSKPRLLIAAINQPALSGDYIFAFDQDSAKRIYVQPPLGGQLLSDVVADISNRAGLDASQYDVTQLANDTVDGYAIAKATTMRSVLEPLRQAYYFDGVESSTKVKFVKRGGATVAEITDADLASASEGESKGDPLLTTRQMEVELPHKIYVTYLLAATKYEPGTKYSSRLIGSSGEETTLDLPLVLTDAKAQEVADVNIHVAWVQRLGYSFTLPKKYGYLEPTDPIVVKQHNMRIVKITRTAKGLYKADAVAEDANYYTPHVVVTETPVIAGSVATPATTVLELM